MHTRLSEGLAQRLFYRARRWILSGQSTPVFRNDDPTARERFGSSTLAQMFRHKRGNQVHKWHHYLEIYEQHLARFRGSKFRMLEIGVFRGGSLELWREYFGSEAIIYGIDIDPECRRYDGIAGKVRIGSQADPEFLSSVVTEMGGLDLVIDDGSHDSRHIRASFDTLFPLLVDNGIYIAEDLHCCYWPAYSGGYRWPWSFISVGKTMIDDMHHWYHGRGERIAASAGHIKALHFYDSMMVIEKQLIERPINSLRPEHPEDDFEAPARCNAS